MTERLYYNDSALFKFEGKILDTGKYEDKYFTVLDRSAFYPTSGGQSHDTGNLNDVEVIDVIEDGDIIKHITKNKVGEINSNVVGEINKERRNFKRQQHTAQHIISQCMYRLYGFSTMSVHLGDEYGSVELDTENIENSQLTESEKLANKAIEDQLPIEILYCDSIEIDSLPMRKPPAREGKIRIIKINDFDYAACGGTHCNNSSEIRFIKFIGIEKIRKRTSVKFICGNQAINDYIDRFNVTTQLGEQFTCHFSDLPESIDKLISENKELKKEITNLNKTLLPIKADQLARSVEKLNRGNIIIEENIELDSKQLTNLALLTAEKISGTVVLISNEKIIISSQPDNIDASKLAKSLMESTSLKGGGNSKLAQLGNLEKTKLDYYKSLIREFLNDV